MKTQRFLIVLTLVNLSLLAYQFAQPRMAEAKTEDSILRGTGLELVDSQGRMRVQFVVTPGDPNFKMPDGTVGYPETVLMRLITADGKPRVKLSTSNEGSGLMVLGDSDDTYSILKADKKESSLKLRNNETTQQVVKP